MSDGKPPERQTARIEQTEILKEMISRLADNVQAGFLKTEKRLDLMDERLDNHEARFSRHSDQVRGTSEHDLVADARLAAEIVAREELAGKVDSLAVKLDENTAVTQQVFTKLNAFASHPIVKQIATAVGTAILVWLSSKGFR